MAVGASAYVLAARTLGPQSFGIYTFVQWLAVVTIPIIGVGSSALSSHRVASIQSHETPRLAAGIFYFLWHRQCHSIVIYALLYLLLAYPLYWLFGICHPLLLLLAGLSALPLLLSCVVGVALRSQRRVDLLAMLQLLGTFSALLFMLVASQMTRERVGMFLLASALAGTVTLIMAVICVTRLLPIHEALRPGIFLKERLLHNGNGSLMLFLCDAIVWQRSELLLLACWRSPDELGFYTLGALVSAGIMQIAPALFASWLRPYLLRRFPRLCSLYSYEAFVKTTCLVAFLTIPLCALALLLCSFVVHYSLGENYLPLVQPLRILFISAALGSIATISLTYLAAHRQQKIQERLGLGAAALNIVLALPLIYLWGMSGAALASTVAQSVSALGSIFLCGRMLKKQESRKMGLSV
jgi:O-antigen/teichoic acid export membrane protein